MSETPRASTYIVRVVHEPGGGVSGVVERVRTGVKEKFEDAETLCRLVRQMLSRDSSES